MKKNLSEKILVVVLFVIVLVIFSFAQEDTKIIEKMYDQAASASSPVVDRAPDAVTEVISTQPASSTVLER